MRKVLSSIFLLCISLCIKLYCAGQALSNQRTLSPESIDRSFFSGSVKDASTGSALAGASVYFADIKVGAITNGAGEFRMTYLAQGRHLVEISFIGYHSHTEYIDIQGDVRREFLLQTTIRESNEVVVTGVSIATQLQRTPTPVSIVKRADLLKITSTNLVDALSRKPGITQLTTGPAISKPIVRGLGYNRVVVLNDGVRQEGQQWGDEHGLEIDEYSVSRVEVLKGPASLIYGSDAMAGVVNIITNLPAPEGTVRGSIVSNYQTNNRLRGLGANIGASKNGFNWNLYGSYKAAADYGNKYDGRVYNSKFNERNFGGYAGYNGSWGYSHLLFSYFNQNPGIVEGDRDDEGRFIKPLPGGLDGLPAESDFNSINPQIPNQDITHFKIVTDNSFNLGAGRLGLNIGFQRNQRIEFGNIDDPEERELFFDLKTVTYNVIYHTKEKNNWRTSIGINGMVQNNTNRGVEVLIPEYSLWDIGGFVYTRKTWDKITLSGGLRADNRSLDSKFFEEGNEIKFNAFKRDFSNISGSAGLSYKPAKALTVKFNMARGFRAPSIPELASNGTHEGTLRYEYGDNDLKSETSLQIDAGLQFDTDHISFEASLFHNSINNFIFYRKLESVTGADSTVEVDGEQIPAFQFNQRKANLAGAEFILDIHPHPLDWLHFENSFSFVNGKFKEAVEGTKNMPLIPAARLLSELRGDFLQKGNFLRNLSVKVEMDMAFDQDNAFTAYNTETPTKGYTILNAGIATDVVTKNKTLFTIYFNAINLEDVAYQIHLNRLKYGAENPVTGRVGVFNMGRNFSIKINIPITTTLK